jgi:hypothetical protein
LRCQDQTLREMSAECWFERHNLYSQSMAGHHRSR